MTKRLLVQTARLLRRNHGQIALEMFAVCTAWVASIVLFGNMVFLLGNAMIFQTQLNRVAMQAAAQGCLSSQSIASITSTGAFLVPTNQILITARTPESESVGQPFDRNDVADSSGEPVAPTSLNDATCDGLGGGPNARDVVPNGHYIWVHIEYKQHFFLMPSAWFKRNALVVSNSLNEGDAG